MIADRRCQGGNKILIVSKDKTTMPEAQRSLVFEESRRSKCSCACQWRAVAKQFMWLCPALFCLHSDQLAVTVQVDSSFTSTHRILCNMPHTEATAQQYSFETYGYGSLRNWVDQQPESWQVAPSARLGWVQTGSCKFIRVHI